MVVEERESKDFKTLILEWIDEGVGEGMNPHAAAEIAVLRTVESGFAAEAFAALATPAVLDFWRSARGQERRNAVMHSGGSRRKLSIQGLDDEESLLDKLVALGSGVWKPWGDLTKRDCAGVAANYKALEAGIAGWRKGWDELQKGLRQNQTVRQRYTDDQLRGIFKGHLGGPDEAVIPDVGLPVGALT